MSVFGLELEWNTLSIQNKMIQYLESKSFKVDTILGFSDEGDSALILECQKDHTHISIEIANERKNLMIKGGLTGDYLPIGKGIPQFKQTFKHTEIKPASEFFVKCVDWCSDHSLDGDYSGGSEKAKTQGSCST